MRAATSAASALLVLVLLAGCLGGDSSEAPDDDAGAEAGVDPGPGPGPDPGTEPDSDPGPDPDADADAGTDPAPGATHLPWNGTVLEGLQCSKRVAQFQVPSERIRPHLPPNYTTATGATEVDLDLWHCDALLLDEGAPMDDAWMYIVHVFRRGSGLPVYDEYVLEFGATHAPVLDAVAAVGTPTTRIAVTVEDGASSDATRTLHVAGDDLRIDLGEVRPRDGPPEEDFPLPHDLLFGPDGGVRMHYNTTLVNDLVLATGVLDAEGGILDELLDAPTPVELYHSEGGLALDPYEPDP